MVIEQEVRQIRLPRWQRRSRGSMTRRDLSVGVGLGLAALAIATAAQSGAHSYPGSIESAVAGPAGAVCCGARSLLGHESHTEQMTVRVRLSGGLQRSLGTPELQVRMPVGSDLSALGERLSADYPSLGPIPMLIAAGSNPMLPEMLLPRQVLSEGDLVELIPPMAGG